MAYKDSKWKIVTQKMVTRKPKKKNDKDPYREWVEFSYVWRTKSTGSRIVCFDMKILSFNKDTNTIDVNYLDRNLKINPDKIIKKLYWLPLSIIK